MASPPPAKPTAPKLKIKLGSFSVSATNSPSTAAPPADTPKPKRKYTKKPKPDATGDDTSPVKTKASKKRPLNDDGDDAEDTGSKKTKKGVTIKLGMGGHKAKEPQDAGGVRPQFLKLRTKSQTLKIKSKAPLGAPPRRDPGHGYDSEADDVEIDPAIEHQFVIRMLPGEDCDFLQKAIAERTIGTKGHEKDVSLHFFDREGRRAVVSIRGNQYAATLVDLPCIVESHKSWDKKGFFKVADIHQMLVVTKRIKNQDEAKSADPPEGVNKSNWQFPHGLTPPLYHVRQRRFRKRVSNRTIEAVEEEVERLLKLDAEAAETSIEIINPNAQDDSEDAEGEDDDEEDIPVQETIETEEDAEGSDVDDELERLITDAMGNDGDEMEVEDETVLPGVELQASPDTLQHTTETPEVLATPATPAGPSATEEEPSDDDESDEDEESELDEDEKARQEERAQLEEEVADIKTELASVDAQIKGQQNRLLRGRLEEKKTKLRRDLQLKLASMGETIEEEDDD
jgi:transcription initiation factor TFIID subunit 7